jgi:transposase
MMGPAKRHEAKLFYVGLNLEERVPADHPLRAVAQQVDFGRVREQVRPLYGIRGNRSVDPSVLMKLMFLLHYENVASERALMNQLPLRLDWLWFVGYDLDETVPDHSVISKARRRWGPETFEAFFADVLGQCVEAGLVDGTVVHVDSSLIEANADRHRLVARRLYEQLDAVEAAETDASPSEAETSPAPADAAPDPAGPSASSPRGSAGAEDGVNASWVSPTDPEAGLTRRDDRTVLGYKDHRAVDDAYGIVTATVTTAAPVADEQMLGAVLEAHEQGVGCPVETVVADKRYAAGATYAELRERGTRACMPRRSRSGRPGRFGPEAFRYDADADVYRCPAGEVLRRSDRRPQKRGFRYYAPRGACPACPLRSRCTKAKRRQVVRHVDQEAIDWAEACVPRAERRRLLRRRKVRAEGSFADATNRHGYKRARGRGLASMRIQNLLIAAAQNIRKLVRYGRRGRKAMAAAGVRLSASHRFVSSIRSHRNAPHAHTATRNPCRPRPGSVRPKRP